MTRRATLELGAIALAFSGYAVGPQQPAENTDLAGWAHYLAYLDTALGDALANTDENGDLRDPRK